MNSRPSFLPEEQISIEPRCWILRGERGIFTFVILTLTVCSSIDLCKGTVVGCAFRNYFRQAKRKSTHSFLQRRTRGHGRRCECADDTDACDTCARALSLDGAVRLEGRHVVWD